MMPGDTESFIGFIMRQMLSLIFVTSVCVALAVLFLRSSTYKYDVSMEITAFSIQNPQSQGVVLPGVSLLGLKDDNPSLTPFGLYLRHLTSYRTAQRLYEDETLLQRFFPSRWDAEQGVWIDPEGPLVNAKNTLAEFIGYPTVDEPKPNIDALWGLIKGNIRFVEIDQSMQRVSIYVEDPEFGVEVLNKLHRIADDNARDFINKSSSERLGLLKARYDQAPIQQVRSNLANLMTYYERLLIMTDGGDNFAAEQIQAPIAGADPSTPDPKLILALSIAIGFILFAFIALIRERRSNNYNRGV